MDKEKLREELWLVTNRWKNRRRMAYISLLSIIIVTYWCLFSVAVERLSVLGEIVSWFFIVMGSVIGAYVGFSAAFDIKQISKKQKKQDGEIESD